MSTVATAQQSKVQLCSVVSAESGEDPIGSAWHTTRYIMLEIPLPWKYAVLESVNVPPGVQDLVNELYAHEIYPGLIGFASDDAYSVEGMTRLIDFVVPEAPFTEYTRAEYLIPTERVAEAVRNSFFGQGSEDLEAYAVSPTANQRDIFVCTHGAIDACCAKFGYPLYKLLRHMADNPMYDLRVWRCTHFGGHRFAATMLDMPHGRYWGHLDPHDLGPIVRREQNAEALRRKYRGWAALPYGAAQVAEGELFRRGGWDWTACSVSVSDTPPFDHGNPTIDEQTVTFTYQHPGRPDEHTVSVHVTPDGFVKTLATSNSPDLMDAQQYITTIVPGDVDEALFGPG